MDAPRHDVPPGDAPVMARANDRSYCWGFAIFYISAELSVVVCDNMERAKKLLDAHKDLPHLKHIVVISPKGELKCPGDQPCGDVELMSFSTLLVSIKSALACRIHI